MKVLIHGALGRMGQAVAAVLDAKGVSHVGVDARAEENSGVLAHISQCREDVDCVIDFSSHLATADVAAFAEDRGVPVVFAATGQTEAEMARIRRCAEKVPVLKSRNLCVGVALLCHLAREAARALPGADIEIVEAHHNQKADVPSGTALMLAEAVRAERPHMKNVVGRHENGKREPEEIGIHSLRLGSVVGRHEVHFALAGQEITQRQDAFDRTLFAQGALAAAQCLMGRAPGLYDMEDLIHG